MLCFTVSITSAYATAPSTISITEQPQDQTVSEGETATFSVTAASAFPMSYQWYMVSSDGRGEREVGTDSPTYTTGALTLENTGQQYYVKVANGIDIVDSRMAMLTVSEGFAITRQPESATMIAGSTATFSVTASGDPPYTYQWYADMNTGRFQAVGDNSSSYSATVSADTDGWQFYVTVTGNGGTVLTSNTVSLHLLSSLVFITHPQSQSVYAGTTASFTAEATGQERIAYKWYVDTGDGRWSEVGSGSTSYTTPILPLAYNGYRYICRAFGDDGRSLDSDPAILTVTPPPLSITRDPANVVVFAGETATFFVEADGGEPLTYHWFVDTGDGLWQEVSTVGSTYTTDALPSSSDGYRYRCVVKDPYGQSETSEAAALQVLTPLAIMQQPQDAVVTQAVDIATFTVTADGEPPIRYQWYLSSDNGATWEPAGSGTPSLSLSAELALHGSVSVYCRMEDPYETVLTTRTATLRYIPVTGDSSRPLLWILLLAGSAVPLTIAVLTLRKHRNGAARPQ